MKGTISYIYPRFILVNYTSIDTRGLTHIILHTTRRLYPIMMMKVPVRYTIATESKKVYQASREAFEVIGCQLDGFCSTYFISHPLLFFLFQYSSLFFFHLFLSFFISLSSFLHTFFSFLILIIFYLFFLFIFFFFRYFHFVGSSFFS